MVHWQVDASGTGKYLVEANIKINGGRVRDACRSTLYSNFVLTHVFQALTQQLTVQFIVNTKCTGGIDKNLCISPYITSSGFGNCVVITQAGKVPDLTQSKSKIG